MRKVREAIGTVTRLVRGGPFRGNHKPVKAQFDLHSYQAVGEAPDNVYFLEDRADQIASAKADQLKDAAWWGQKSW